MRIVRPIVVLGAVIVATLSLGLTPAAAPPACTRTPVMIDPGTAEHRVIPARVDRRDAGSDPGDDVKNAEIFGPCFAE